MTDTTPSITCPRCSMTSYNFHDIRWGYCGNCKEFTGKNVAGTPRIPPPGADWLNNPVVTDKPEIRNGPTRPPVGSWYDSKLLWLVVTLVFVVSVLLASGVISL